MKKISGKLISDNSITQSNLSILTSTITGLTSVTNKEYVDQSVFSYASGVTESWFNLDMTAKVASIGDKACDKAVIGFPTNVVLVYVNGLLCDVGSGQSCYFSPDGITIRSGRHSKKGDYLYWNSSKYNLDSGDTVDFVYLINQENYVLGSGTTAYFNSTVNNIIVEYSGSTGTTMTMSISSSGFTVGNVGGQFVWDIGGPDEYTFTSENEFHNTTIVGKTYKIWYDGIGNYGLIFSIEYIYT